MLDGNDQWLCQTCLPWLAPGQGCSKPAPAIEAHGRFVAFPPATGPEHFPDRWQLACNRHCCAAPVEIESMLFRAGPIFQRLNQDHGAPRQNPAAVVALPETC